MWGAFHRHSVISFPLLVLLLVVVHQIDIYHITVFEAENDTPVTADGDAPVPFQIAFQRVQAISGESNVRRAYRRIEVGQYISNACELIRPNLAGVTVLKRAFFNPRWRNVLITSIPYRVPAQVSRLAVLVEIQSPKKNALKLSASLLAAEFWRSSLPSAGKPSGRSPHTPLQHACGNSI